MKFLKLSRYLAIIRAIKDSYVGVKGLPNLSLSSMMYKNHCRKCLIEYNCKTYCLGHTTKKVQHMLTKWAIATPTIQIITISFMSIALPSSLKILTYTIILNVLIINISLFVSGYNTYRHFLILKDCMYEGDRGRKLHDI